MMHDAGRQTLASLDRVLSHRCAVNTYLPTYIALNNSKITYAFLGWPTRPARSRRLSSRRCCYVGLRRRRRRRYRSGCGGGHRGGHRGRGLRRVRAAVHPQMHRRFESAAAIRAHVPLLCRLRLLLLLLLLLRPPTRERIPVLLVLAQQPRLRRSDRALLRRQQGLFLAQPRLPVLQELVRALDDLLALAELLLR